MKVLKHCLLSKASLILLGAAAYLTLSACTGGGAEEKWEKSSWPEGSRHTGVTSVKEASEKAGYPVATFTWLPEGYKRGTIWVSEPDSRDPNASRSVTQTSIWTQDPRPLTSITFTQALRPTEWECPSPKAVAPLPDGRFPEVAEMGCYQTDIKGTTFQWFFQAAGLPSAPMGSPELTLHWKLDELHCTLYARLSNNLTPDALVEVAATIEVRG